MKAFLLLMAAAACSTTASAIIRCELDGKSINVNNGGELAGRSGMVRCKEEDIGHLQREQELRNGKFIGLQRMYDREGRLHKELTVNDKGNTQGKVVEFWPGGQARREEFMENGSNQGPVRRFDATGRMTSVGFYSDRQQVFVLEFNSKGQPSGLTCPPASVMVEDRKPCGFEGAAETALHAESGARSALLRHEQGRLLSATEWAANGAMAVQLLVEEGRRVHRGYYTDGGKSVLREERIYLPDDRPLRDGRGQLHSARRFGASGQIIEQRSFAEGRESLVERWYLNGSVRERSAWTGKGEQARVRSELYRDDGKLARVEQLTADQRPVGVQQSFHANGRLATEDTYTEPDARRRTRLVARKQWDEGGRLVADDTILEDGSRQRKAGGGLDS